MFKGSAEPLSLVLLLLVTPFLSKAYQPGVVELEDRISNMEQRIDLLDLSSPEQLAECTVLQDSIIQIKDRIIDLKGETIVALRKQRSMQGNDRATLGLISFGLLMVALLSFAFILTFRKQVANGSENNVFAVLTMDLKNRVAPEDAATRARRVHPLVMLSVLIMLCSILMYLIRIF